MRQGTLLGGEDILELKSITEKNGEDGLVAMSNLAQAEFLIAAELSNRDADGSYVLKKYKVCAGNERLLDTNGLRVCIGADKPLSGTFLIPCVLRLVHGTKYPVRTLMSSNTYLVKLAGLDDPALKLLSATADKNLFRRENWMRWVDIKNISAKLNFVQKDPHPPKRNLLSVDPPGYDPNKPLPIQTELGFGIKITFKNNGDKSILFPEEILRSSTACIALRSDGLQERSLNGIMYCHNVLKDAGFPTRKWLEILPGAEYVHVVAPPTNPPAIPRCFNKAGIYEVFAVVKFYPVDVKHPTEISALSLQGTLISETLKVEVIEKVAAPKDAEPNETEE
jgi:hypothetical protein